ncbi:hypothetical protein BDR03DRAFT_969708 [Suillus americanus]|nr:hypothetical protein BDR03DRAFT_969708 [Suillus americanus]
MLHLALGLIKLVSIVPNYPQPHGNARACVACTLGLILSLLSPELHSQFPYPPLSPSSFLVTPSSCSVAGKADISDLNSSG